MKQIFLLSFMVVICSYQLLSLEQTIIGTVGASGIPSFSVSQLTLRQAFEDELNDGTTVSSVDIKQASNGTWYLLGYGSNSSTYLILSIILSKDANDNLTIALIEQNAKYKICSTVNCINCCDWDVCICNSCGGQCSAAYDFIDNGIGYLGTFY